MIPTKLKDKIANLPTKPGVYFFKTMNGKILYIGKAKSLKKRVSSYFSKKHEDKTALLVREIRDIDFIATDNEVEALILEARLIRQHKPHYNIDLKDGTRYAYLKVTNEEYPRLLTVRKREKDKAKYYGPFTDGTARESSARLLRTIFKIRTCGAKLPKNVCLQYYIGNCNAPCVKKVNQKDYADNVAKMSGVLAGRSKSVTKLLEQEMKRFSDRKIYELAKQRRDQIHSLNKFKQKQKIAMHKTHIEDILNYLEIGDELYLQLFHVDKEGIRGKQEFVFDAQPGVVESFIRQYYSTNEIPDVLSVPRRLKEHELMEAYLTKSKEKKVRISVPVRGDNKKLMDMVYKNVVLAAKQEDRALVNLRDHLNLSGIPYVIECFDVSTIQGKYNVGSMVQFRGGVPDKSNYRKFKIRTVNQQDDFASMAELVNRRYTRLKKEKKALPNLIVIDGGKGQLSAAWDELVKLGLSIPIIGLAKREEEIYRIETEKVLKLSKREPGLKMLQQVRNEAHRFAIAYHRLLRKKGMVK